MTRPAAEPQPYEHHHNLRGIVAMLVSMAAFTLNDVCVKLAAATLPLGEIIVLRGGFATLFIAAGLVAMAGGIGAAVRALGPARLPDGLGRLLGWRVAGEVAATLLFLAALVRMQIADVTAIMQFTPLAVTAGAALLLGEPVGWRRWLAAGVGLVGVLLIVRPGSTAFTPAALLALAAIGFVVMRDLATRQIPAATIPTATLTLMSATTVMASGFLLAPFEAWRWPDGDVVALMMLAGLALVAAYAFIVIGMRAGEVAVVGPFRYSVILWALLAGIAVWGQWPDATALAGIAIVTAAGVYAFHRERAGRSRDAAIRPEIRPEIRPASSAPGRGSDRE